MDDLISRKALIAEYDRVHIGPPGGARKLMEDAPVVDAVPVVRCKDCQYAKLPHTPEMQKLFRRCDIHGVEVSVNNNHFCACGERKDNDL